jgi:hypothetical protein
VIVKAFCDAITEGAAERKLDKEMQEDEMGNDMGDMNIDVDIDEEQPAKEIVTDVKGVKKVKDVASDEEKTLKRKRIPTKKAPVKTTGKAPAKK